MTIAKNYRFPDHIAAAIDANPNSTAYLVSLVEADIARREGTSPTLALPSDAVEHLRGIANPAGYVANVLGQRAMETAMSLAELRQRGWTPTELRVACGITLGTMAIPGQPCTWLASDMDHPRSVVQAEQAGIPLGRWRELVDRIAADEPEARAVFAIAAEYWADNDAVCSVLDAAPLDRLVDRITSDNRHDAVDWGPARGREEP